MDRKQLIIRIAAGLAIVAVLTAAGIGLYRLGYTNGIAAADAQVARAGLAAASDTTTTPENRRGANDERSGRQNAAPGTGSFGDTRGPNSQQSEDRTRPDTGNLRNQQALNSTQPGVYPGSPAQVSNRPGNYPQNGGQFATPLNVNGTQAQDGSGRLPAAPYQSPLTRSWASPLGLVLLTAVIGFSLWIIYRFVTLMATGNGWQLSFSRVEGPAATTKTKK